MSKAKPIAGLSWIEFDSLPFGFGVVLTEKAWLAEQARLGMKYHEMSDHIPSFAQAKVGVLENTSTGALKVYMHLDVPGLAALNPTDAVRVIVHESVHVWQYLKETIREREASEEFEAYTIDFIVGKVMGIVSPLIGRQNRKK